MSFLPTITKLFIAGCCALLAFTAMEGNRTKVREVHVSGASIPSSTTTTTIAIVQNSTTTIPIREEPTLMEFLYEDIKNPSTEEEIKTVEVPATTTTIQITTTTDKWGVVSDEDMETYEEQFKRSHHEIGNYKEIPFLIDNMYAFWEKGPHIIELQRMLGMAFVDGIYGPSTRRAHMEWFGSFEAAQRYFFDRETWYLETVRESPDDEAGWVHNWADWDNPPTLEQLVDIYFEPIDKAWALRVAFCESSALPSDTYSNAVSSALAVGWFQHLSKFWLQRSQISGWAGYDIFDSEPNVAVAAWLFYETGGAERHWNPSRSCWKDTPHGQ